MMRRSFIRYLATVFLIGQGFSISAQENRLISDLELIKKELTAPVTKSVTHPFINKDESSLLKRVNPFRIVYGGALFVYQNGITRHISADCLYTPSCSEFSRIAIRETGFLTGFLLTVDRINRCNIISAQDLEHYEKDSSTGRFPDPVTRYQKSSWHEDR